MIGLMFFLMLLFVGCSQGTDKRLVPAWDDGKWGYINAEGSFVIEPQFDEANDFSEGLAAVCVNGKWGFVDEHGEYAIKPVFNSVDNFSEGLAVAEKEKGKFGYIDKYGDYAIEPQEGWDDVYSFKDGLAAIRNKEEQCSFINTSGEYVFPQALSSQCNFSEGMLAINENGYWGFVDKTGSIVIEPQYFSVGDFNEGLAVVEEDYGSFGLFGFIDKSGNVVLEPQFDYAIGFSEGLATFANLDENQNLKAGCIDTEGNWIIEPEFDWISNFVDGLAIVAIDGKNGVIDKTGKYVIELSTSFDGIETKNGITRFYNLKEDNMEIKEYFVYNQGKLIYDSNK